jgi:hypothetical protein
VVELTLSGLEGVPAAHFDPATHPEPINPSRLEPESLRLISDPLVRRLVGGLVYEKGVTSLELGPRARLRLELNPWRWRERLIQRPPRGTSRADSDGARAGARVARWLLRLERLAGAAEAALREEGGEGPLVRVDSRGGDPVCPYCRDGVRPDEEQRACPSCDTRHHGDCWDEAGGCTLLGCRGRAAPRGRVR